MHQKKSLQLSHSRRDSLKTLKLFITDKCNMDCTYCYVRKKDHKGALTTGECVKSIDDFFADGGEEKVIQFLGGEPLLEYEKIKTIIKHAAKKYPNVSRQFILSTNGLLIDQEKINFLNRHGVLVIVSLDGSKQVHDLYRKIRGSQKSSYDVIANNLSRVNLSNTILMISCVFTESTIDCLAKNIKHLARSGFRMIDFQADVNAPIGKKYEVKLRKFLKDFSAYYLNVFRKKKKNEMFFVPAIKSVLLSRKKSGNRTCDSLLLSPDKNYYSCGRLLGLNQKQKKPYAFGNIESGIDKRKRLTFLTKTKNEIDKIFPKCRRCDFLPHCLCKIATFAYCIAKGENVAAGLETICLYSRLFNGAMLSISETLLREQNADFKRIYRFDDDI
ncbi:MAG: radical SAM protein [Patescibacteria group bacterium]|nr:radical SAM protein [Patescibacteria group bacterium]